MSLPASITKTLWVQKKYALHSILVLFLLGTMVESGYAQFSNGYNKRILYATDHTQVSGPSPLTNFPVLVSITDPDLRSSSNGGSVQNPNGYDIIFTAGDGSTQLDHQVESYNPATGQIIAWVRFPTLSNTTDTPFYLYYDNDSVSNDPSNSSTWDANYVGVYHFNQNLSDGTSLQNDGINNGTSSTSGQIAGARDFNGTSGFVRVPHDASQNMSSNNQVTVSAWVRKNSVQSGWRAIVQKSDVSYNLQFNQGNSNQPVFTIHDGDWHEAVSPNDLNNNEWYHLSGTFDGSTVRLFVNGSQSATATANGISSTNDDIGIGENIDANGRFMDGQIDEVRISNVARPANWIATEYNNQNNPAGFISRQTNTAPTINNLDGDLLNYPESSAALILDQSPFATITENVQTLQNGSLKVSFNSGFQTGDVLSIQNQGTGVDEIGVSGSNITYEGDLIGSFSGGTGGTDLDIIFTTSDATIEAVEALISSILFENTAASTNNVSREVQFILTDGDGLDSSPAAVTVNIQTSLDDLSTGIANTIFHFDAKDVNGDLNLGNQPSNGSNIQTWGDRSDNATGNGPDLSFSNGNSNQQPVFSTTSLGGLEGLVFDGSNDGLIRSSNNLLNSGTYDEKSFAVIFRTGSNISSNQVVYEQGGGTRGYLIGIFDGDLFAYVWNVAEWSGSNQHKSINLGSVQANTNYIVIASHDATASSLAQRTWTANVNGGSLQMLNSADQQQPHPGVPGIGVVDGGARNPATLGNLPDRANFGGTISEFASWNQALSPQNFTAIHDYLYDKWFTEPPQTPDIVWQSNAIAAFFGLDEQWNRGFNWSTGQVPGPGDVVLIPSNPSGYDSFPIISNDQTISGLQIESGADVTLNGSTLSIQEALIGDGSFEGNNGTLQVGGDISLADLSPNNSTLILNGNSTQRLSGSVNIDALQLQNTSGIESDGSIVTQTIDIPTSNSLVMRPGATLEITDDVTGAGTLTADQSTVTFGGVISTLSTIDVTTSDVRLNGNANQQISNFNIAANLVIDNSAGATVTPGNNLEVTGTLTLSDGQLTMESGTNLIANTKSLDGGDIRFLRTLEGGTGWRLLAPPAVSSYGDFLDSTVTQGYPGAFYDTNTPPNDTLQPNVLYYDETYPGTDNQRWRAPSDSSATPNAGVGMFVYVFGDIPADPRYSNPLPDTLSIIGQEHEGNGTTFTFPVTYTTEADSGWNLVGNPFGATIDWDNNSEWIKTNIDGAIYVWDPNTNSYKTWNGVTGSLNNGLISPFQGFWVKANGNSPVLSVNKSAKTTGGTFKGKRSKNKTTDAPIVELNASYESNSVSTFLMFSEKGTNGKDPLDAFDLVLPPGIQTYMELFTVNKDGQRFAINHLPRDFGKPIEIPLELNNFEEGVAQSGQITITWPEVKNIPQGWSITLLDKQTNISTELFTQTSYQFNYLAPKNKTASNSSSYNSGFSVTKKSKAQDTRFVLKISPGQDADGVPAEFGLKQNYPNPFNPQTTIPFSLPVESDVRITIYDILGRRVTTLVNETLSAGNHEIQWNASQLASGIYIYRMQANNQVITKKLTVIK